MRFGASVVTQANRVACNGHGLLYSNGIYCIGTYLPRLKLQHSTTAHPANTHSTRPYTLNTSLGAMSERAAAEKLHPGDQVEWGAPVPGRGKTEGEVVEIVEHDTQVASNHFKGSKDNPKVRVKSSKTGKEAVHKPSSVRKIAGGDAEEEEEDDDEEYVEEEEDDEEDEA